MLWYKRFLFYSSKMFLPFLVLALVLHFFPNLSEIWASFLVAWIPYAVSETYHSWPQMQFWVQKVRLRISPATIQWMAQAEYKSPQAARVFDEVYKYLVEERGWRREARDNNKITLFHPQHYTYLTLEVAHIPQPSGDIASHLIVRTALNAPFRTGIQTLDRLVSLFDWIRSKSGGSIEWEEYLFRVRFPRTNPYFGLFIRALKDYEENLSFQIEFQDGEGKIFVSGAELEIWAPTPHSLEKLSQRYITLSAFPEGVALQ